MTPEYKPLPLGLANYLTDVLLKQAERELVGNEALRAFMGLALYAAGCCAACRRPYSAYTYID